MSRSTEAVVAKQRKIQSAQDARDERAKAKGSSAGSEEGAVQAGVREHPAEQPAQHLPKPGVEAQLQQKPQFEAPDYRGSAKLKGFATLITGGDSGIGRAVAVLFAREGADVAFVYLNEEEADARETCRWVERQVAQEGDEPQAGDRHRPFAGTARGCQGAAQACVALTSR